MRTTKIIGVCLLLIVLGVVFRAAGLAGWWGKQAIVTAKQEFSPQEMLRKYEWFKDAAAQLDKKRADIRVYQARVDALKVDYEGVSRKDWDRTDKEQMSGWQAESAGVKASYNGLAAEYNAQMSKFNWRFCNAGTLPQGATDTLPREFASYSTP